MRSLSRDEWRSRRDELADEVAWLSAGPVATKWDNVADRVVSLLSTARALSNEEFKAQHVNLEKTAKDIVGPVGPDGVLRNRVEWLLSELLSNPRLEAAAKLRLKR